MKPKKIDLGHYGYACPTCNGEMNIQVSTCQECGTVTESTRRTPGDILRKRMAMEGYTQVQLSELTGMNKGHIANIVTNNVKMSKAVAIKLMDVFKDTDVYYWIGTD